MLERKRQHQEVEEEENQRFEKACIRRQKSVWRGQISLFLALIFTADEFFVYDKFSLLVTKQQTTADKQTKEQLTD